ncbi:MAG: hypothetical protein MHM6MM_003575 [Cercozoa sp. M6MM]
MAVQRSAVEQWLYSIPPVTRTLFLASCSLTVLTSLGFLDPMKLLFVPDFIKEFQVWRLATAAVFVGGFSFSFLISQILLLKYGATLETQHFSGHQGRADLTFMLLCCMALFYACAWLTPRLNFFAYGPSLINVLLYVWSRKNIMTPVSMYGFQMKAWHLPFALCVFHLVIGQSIVSDLLSIFAGHLYVFLTDIAERCAVFSLPGIDNRRAHAVGRVNGKRTLQTPNAWSRLFAPAQPHVARSRGHRLR